jgi:hypothetical protein
VTYRALTVVLMNNGRHPRFLRSDHGTETVMIAGARSVGHGSGWVNPDDLWVG